MAVVSAPHLSKDRQICGSGTPESVWQSWSGLSSLKEVHSDDLVPQGARAVIVAPHPDDEVLGTGGLIAELVRSQRPFLMIAVTDGTASHPGSALWPPERLARERPLESQRALAFLGAVEPPMTRLGFQDGELKLNESRLVQALSRHVMPQDVVFTTWRLDGHPDHEACGRACATVATHADARLIEVPIWAWHWASPADSRVPWDRACRLSLSPSAAGAKVLAAQAFVSQTTPDPGSREGCVLPPSALERLLRPMEVFFR